MRTCRTLLIAATAVCAGMIDVTYAVAAIADADYTRLEYLESTGAQYIDTGIMAKSGTKAKIDFVLTSIPSDGGILAARNDSGNTRFYLAYYYNGFIYGYGTLSSSSGTLVANTRYVSETTLEKNSQYIGCTPYSGGTTISKSGTSANAYDYTKTLHLFGMNNGGTSAYRVSMKLYSCKIWQKDESGEYRLVRDFRPAKDNSAETDLARYGLYDKVEGKFYVCGSSTAFGYGEISGGADDYVVTVDGTTTLESPFMNGEGGLLVNYADACTFDQSGYAVASEYANTFTGFVSLENAGTTFRSGWWDFGGGAFPVETNASYRTTVLTDGAKVVNAGECCLAGTFGTDNTLSVRGGSTLDVSTLVLGRSVSGGQNSHVEISGGGAVSVSGMLSFSECGVSKSKRLTGNEVVVSNANSCLTVAGGTYLERQDIGAKYNGSVGGNTLVVTDQARANLNALNIATAGASGISNRVEVSKGGVMTIVGLNVATDWYNNDAPYDHFVCFEVLDGGVVTNTGRLKLGYGSPVGRRGFNLVVSNGTFVSKSFNPLSIPYSCIRISGSQTEFRLGDVYDYNTPLFGGAAHAEIVVENGASLELPIGYGYSYTSANSYNTVSVRTGARLDGLAMCMGGYSSHPDCFFNTFNAEGGACVTTGCFRANSHCGLVAIADARLVCTNGWYYNGNADFFLGYADEAMSYSQATNVVLRMSGTAPQLRAEGDVRVIGGSKMVFVLPKEGYASNALPLVRVGHDMVFHEGDVPNRIVLEGAEEMLEYHKSVLQRKASYDLIDVKSFTKSGETPQDVAAIVSAANATLPDGVSLEVVQYGTRQKIVLHVRPMRGFILILE